MKKIVRLLVFVLVLSAFAASSAQACFTAKEREAEQGIRIHSELMIIGLTCGQTPKFQRFTQKNGDLIAGYETTLINHYKAEGTKNPEKKFNTLQTDVANGISNKASAMSVDAFCSKYAAHLDQALNMDEAKFRRWAQHVSADRPVSEKLCSKD